MPADAAARPGPAGPVAERWPSCACVPSTFVLVGGYPAGRSTFRPGAVARLSTCQCRYALVGGSSCRSRSRTRWRTRFGGTIRPSRVEGRRDSAATDLVENCPVDPLAPVVRSIGVRVSTPDPRVVDVSRASRPAGEMAARNASVQSFSRRGRSVGGLADVEHRTGDTRPLMRSGLG
jgi:hypothetical protein